METSDSTPKKNSNSFFERNARACGFLAIFFLATTILFAVLYFTKNSQLKEIVVKEQQVTKDREDLVRQLDSLKAEHARIKAQAGGLADSLATQDSIIMAQIAEIEGLMARQADYNSIKRKLDRVQKISQRYVHQMDSLITIQHKLEQQNAELTTQLTTSQEKITQITTENQELTDKISTAAELTANSIRACCVYSKSRNKPEEVTTKASRAERIKTTFTLAANSLTEPGEYNLYCRVSCPGDGHVLTPGKADAYTFMNNGQRLQYTVKKTVNYVNRAENVTMYWDISDQDRKQNKQIKGTYIVQIFSDKGLLGETRFTLE